MINISVDAIDEINQKYCQENKAVNVRVQINGIGWGGPTFGIALDSVKENDIIKKFDLFNLIVEEELIKLFGGFDIDYLDSWIGKSMLVTPNRGGSTC